MTTLEKAFLFVLSLILPVFVAAPQVSAQTMGVERIVAGNSFNYDRAFAEVMSIADDQLKTRSQKPNMKKVTAEKTGKSTSDGSQYNFKPHACDNIQGNPFRREACKVIVYGINNGDFKQGRVPYLTDATNTTTNVLQGGTIVDYLNQKYTIYRGGKIVYTGDFVLDPERGKREMAASQHSDQ